MSGMPVDIRYRGALYLQGLRQAWRGFEAELQLEEETSRRDGGRVIYTNEGTFCTMATAADRKQAAPAVTEVEKQALFSSMYAYCGKYTVDGAKVSTLADTAWAHEWLTSPHDGKWEVKGKTLTIETTPFKSMRDGVEVIAIVQYERE